jgi:hypothetical protein
MPLEQAWVHQFNAGFNIQLQQEQGLLMQTLSSAMVHKNVTGAIDYHDRLGVAILRDQVNPYGPIQPLLSSNSRRAVTLISSAGPLLHSDEDRIRMMTNPNDGFLKILLAASQRRIDKHIIDAAIGAAVTTSMSNGTLSYGSQAMLAGNIIGGATAFDLTRTIAASLKLGKAGATVSTGKLTMVYSPGQRPDLLAITQASSSDFTKNQIHDKGTLHGINWEGFTWYEVPDVVDEATATLQTMLPLAATTRSCIAYHEGAIGVSVGRDPQTHVSVRNDLDGLPTQIRVALMMAAVRVWEGGVVQINALEN